MKSLSFHNTRFAIVQQNGQPWLSAAQLAQALGYAREDAVSRIYARNADEFTQAMTTTVNLTVVRKTGSVQMENRIFSLRGAHLIAMFARTAVAKEFRCWVLDILDQETARQTAKTITLTDEELQTLAWCWRAADNMLAAVNAVYPLLRLAEHREAGRYCSIGQEYPRVLNSASAILAAKLPQTSSPYICQNTKNMLGHLHA